MVKFKFIKKKKTIKQRPSSEHENLLKYTLQYINLQPVKIHVRIHIEIISSTTWLVGESTDYNQSHKLIIFIELNCSKF